MSSLTRRDVLGMAAALLPVIACAPDITDATLPAVDAMPDDAVLITNDSVLVWVERIPALRTVDMAVVLLAARVIVVRTGTDTFRALSADCPHSGCGVSVVDTLRLICPCHGSEFDFRGDRLAGPAPTGLRVLRAVFDAAAGVLQVARSSAPQLRPNSSRA